MTPQQMRYAHGLIYHTKHTAYVEQQQASPIQIATSPWPKDKKISRNKSKTVYIFVMVMVATSLYHVFLSQSAILSKNCIAYQSHRTKYHKL